ncbi:MULTISPECIES: hypothetical protein [unclassified Streptomyces]|uniref:hypothetical protein n=1 Tax=unclassified Streptomyces TaxID=2593676 RepID=UPI003633B9DB
MDSVGRVVRRGTALGALSVVLGMLTTGTATAGTATAGTAAAGQDSGALSARVATAPENIQLGSWMSQLGSAIGDRPLNQIVMPGSHDAASAGITKNSGMCDAGDTVDTARMWPELASSMSRTQSGSLVEQLEAGSRYLDLRLCKQGDRWYSYHGGPLGRQFFDALGGNQGIIPGEARELADWINRHPKEIVILRVKTTGPAATLKEDSRAAISELGGMVGGGRLDNPAIADESLKPTSTYDEFMAAGKHVVVVDDTDSTSYPWAWQQPDVQDYRGSYVGVSAKWDDILKAALDPALEEKTYDAVLKRGDEVLGRTPEPGSEKKLFVQQGIIDPSHSIPSAAVIQILDKLKLVSEWKADNFLISMENELNRRLLAKLRASWNNTNVTDNMNIVMTDDVNQNRNGVAAGELQREIISKNLPQRITSHTFYNSTRKADGTWTGPSALSGAGNAFRYVGDRQAVSAMPDGGVQVLGVGVDGNIWHNIRRADGGWQGWNALQAADNKNVGFAAEDIALTTSPRGDAQVVAVGKDGYAYHNIRYADGNWQGWAAMPGQDAGLLKATRIAAARMPDGSTQVLVFGGDGRMRLGTRAADGAWSAWKTVAGVNAPDFQGPALSIAALPNGDSQIAAIGIDGNIWHTIHRADGGWSGWGLPAGVSGGGMGASTVSLTGMPDGSVQVAAVGHDGDVYHAERFSSGDWTPFQRVSGIRGAGTFAGDQVGITGLPDGSSRLILTTR